HARRLDAHGNYDGDAQALAIERICALVGGLPLALELAARGVLVSGCAAIADRLEAGAPLADPDRAPDDRRRSVEAVLRDAWARLRERLRDAACRLALLPPEFDAPRAAALGGVAIDDIDELRGQSWLAKTSGDHLAMHPLQRDFVRRERDAAALAETIDGALAEHVAAALPVVALFADWIAD